MLHAWETASRQAYRGLRVSLQWMQGHVGIPGNVKADSLWNEAHRLTTVLSSKLDLHQFVRDLHL